MRNMKKKLKFILGGLAALAGIGVGAHFAWQSTILAMCYAVAMPMERIEYVCLECGGKTLYPNLEQWIWGMNINYRRLVKKLQTLGLDITLDERSFCHECRATMDLEPVDGYRDKYEWHVVITYNGKTTRSQLGNWELEKLIAYLENKKTWREEIMDEGEIHYLSDEQPLEPELPLIRQLLGL